MTRKVLIIDDSKFACRCLKDALEKVDKELLVETLTDSKEALDLIKQDPTRFNFLVVDFNMPNLNGIELFQEIRKVSTSLPVVMLTASSAFETGAREIPEELKIIGKPITEEKSREILNYIESIC